MALFPRLMRKRGRLSLLVSLLSLSVSTLAATENGFVLDGALIRPGEILRGGPGRDGIPSLDQPKVVTANAADYLQPGDRVLGVEINGFARAYPIRILNYHEIVNDIVAGHPIVITYCPLCGTGMAFDARRDGEIMEFGVSGLLYNSDVLLYDRQTGSLWSQILKMAVTGEMKGTKLSDRAVSHTTWQDWLARHPRTDVLSDRTGFRRNYSVDPYPGYSKSGQLYFPVAHENSAYPRKSLVLGLEIDGRFRAYPFSELQQTAAIEFADELGGIRFRVVYDDENQTARVVGDDDREIPSLIAFWFAWYAFHPNSEIYTAP